MSRVCNCTADTQLWVYDGCAVCRHRDHGPGGCDAAWSGDFAGPYTRSGCAACIYVALFIVALVITWIII